MLQAMGLMGPWGSCTAPWDIKCLVLPKYLCSGGQENGSLWGACKPNHLWVSCLLGSKVEQAKGGWHRLEDEALLLSSDPAAKCWLYRA